jgi:hypothetical protein
MKGIMKKNKSEPPADKKLIKKLHDKWCRANGYKLQASSFKPQAPSLTAGPGDDRMNLERNNYGHNTIEKNSRRSGGDPETGEEGHGTT